MDPPLPPLVLTATKFRGNYDIDALLSSCWLGLISVLEPFTSLISFNCSFLMGLMDTECLGTKERRFTCPLLLLF